ncbi:MAG TPA: hypothetical protein VEZ24_14995 [Microvirga sp.]|nr:hypothetical protein [Microvirga sp.]
MKTYRHRNHVASRVHRMDLRQQSRCSLALIMLMGLATLSVLATTKTLSAQDKTSIPLYSLR